MHTLFTQKSLMDNSTPLGKSDILISHLDCRCLHGILMAELMRKYKSNLMDMGYILLPPLDYKCRVGISLGLWHQLHNNSQLGNSYRSLDLLQNKIQHHTPLDSLTSKYSSFQLGKPSKYLRLLLSRIQPDIQIFLMQLQCRNDPLDTKYTHLIFKDCKNRQHKSMVFKLQLNSRNLLGM